LSLLNIAEMKKYFGPSLREYWEGIHESFIQNIKRELDNMRHTEEFLGTVLRKVLCTMVLEWLNEDNPYNQKTEYARTDKFKIYKTDEASSVLAKNNAVSGIIDKQGKMILCVEQGGQFALHPVVFNNDDGGYWKYNLWYSRAEVGAASEVYSSRKEVLEQASDYFLMLRPIVPHQSDTEHHQTVICRSWRVRNQSGELALPMPKPETLLMETDE